jgi:ATP-dependent exoDNAse (exonuclease V) beta subunit
MTETEKKLFVYKASAGSGKTTALAIEYLKLSLGKQDAFKHILALTFTNKAAQEMKDRILKYLQELVDMKDKDLYNKDKEDEEGKEKAPFYLNDLLAGIPKYRQLSELKSRDEAIKALIVDAKRLFKLLLHHYSEYAVTTLDSFTNRLIRSFSHDLGLSFNYQVELDTDQILKDAVEELLSRIGSHDDLLTSVIVQYSHQKIDSERSRRINGELELQAKSLLNDVEEEHLRPLRKLELEDMLSVPKRVKEAIGNFEKSLQALGQDFLMLCKEAGISANMFYRGNSGIYGFFSRFSKADFSKTSPNTYTIDTVENLKWTKGTASQATKDLIEPQEDKILAIYNQTIGLIQENYPSYRLLLQIKKRIFPYMVLMELEKVLSQIKAENELVHISDFNKIISEKIANESAPYIYERIGNKYHHYLLDEFQDTSVIQWHNLLPLVENALAENHYNLIVGDAKQAIYRWRGSEVEQFAKLPELLNKKDNKLLWQREKMLLRSYQEVQLNHNFRSGKTIIEFNNRLFGFIKEHGYLPASQSFIYQQHQQELSPQNDKNSSVDIHILDINDCGKKKECFLDIYLSRTLEIIQECISQGYDFKDIAVLARGNKDMIAIAEYLIEHDIPVISSESLHVDSSPQVQFILSLMRYIQSPQEKVFQAEVLRYLLENNYMDHKDLSDYSSCLSALNPDHELKKIWEEIGVNIQVNELFALEAYEAIEELVRLFSMNTGLPLLHFFIEAGYIFTQEKHQGLVAFMEWWDVNHKDFKLDVPEGWNAVKLMTFHKAKGLEFPVVINWFSQKISPDKSGQNMVWINPKLKEFPEISSFPFELSTLEDTIHDDIYRRERELSLLDQINLFYVANTRPTEMLFVLVDAPPKGESKAQGVKFGNLMSAFVQGDGFVERQQGGFHLGSSFKKKDSKTPKTDEMVSLDRLTTDYWKKYVHLAIEEPNKAWNESAAWGQKVHAVLAEIVSEKDLETVLKSLLFQGILSEDEGFLLEGTIENVIRHPQLKDYYSTEAEVYNERELLGADAKLKRPDRMVVYQNTLVIIDYKTGQPTEKDHHQVQEYMQLASLHFQLPAKAYLVYLHDEIEVIEVENIPIDD